MPPAKKTTVIKPAAEKAIKRELIEPTKGDKRFVRRDAKGQFKDVGRSLSADSRRTAKTKGPKWQGDRGDTR